MSTKQKRLVKRPVVPSEKVNSWVRLARRAYQRGALREAKRLLNLVKRYSSAVPKAARILSLRVDRAILRSRPRKAKVKGGRLRKGKRGGIKKAAVTVRGRKRLMEERRKDQFSDRLLTDETVFFRRADGAGVGAPRGWLDFGEGRRPSMDQGGGAADMDQGGGAADMDQGGGASDMDQGGGASDTDQGGGASDESRESAPARTTITRFPHMRISFDSPLYDVEVYANKKKAMGETSEPIEISARQGQRFYDVTVCLSVSKHFKIEGLAMGSLRIDQREDQTARLHFTLPLVTPRAAGESMTISANFVYLGRPCGKVTQVMGGAKPGLKLGSIVFSPDDPVPDLVVTVTNPNRDFTHLECQVYSKALHGTTPPAPEPWILTDRSEALVQSYMHEFVQKGTPAQYVQRLNRAGDLLYRAAPEHFKQVFWDLIDRRQPPHSILIVSEEPFIPWELMRPARSGPPRLNSPRNPLGVDFAVGRWTTDDNQAPPTRVNFATSLVVAPDYTGTSTQPLATADQEAQLVMAAVRGQRVKPADQQSVETRLGQADYSLVHFACHGANSPSSGIQEVCLENNTKLSSFTLPAVPAAQVGFKARPFVFLNACEVGRPTAALVGIGGFAAAFIELGAAGVVAPLWSVRDSIAFEVARQFYDEVGRGKNAASPPSFAEILAKIRRQAYGATAEDTYAAYCFYGDPLSVPMWGQA